MKKNFLQILLAVLSVAIFATCKKDKDKDSASDPVIVHWEKVNFPSSATVNFLKANGTNLYAATNAGVFLSADNGVNWTAINNGLPQNKNICALAFSGQNIYAGLKDSNAIFLSTNNGSSWVMSNNGIPYLSGNPSDHNIVGIYTNGTNLFACTRFRGIYLSTDNASNWTAVNNGFEWMPIGGHCGTPSMTFNGSNLFAGFKSCGANGSTAVYKSTNNGSNWTHSSNGLPHISVISIASHSGNLFVTGDSGQIHKSTNNGDSWILSNSGILIYEQNIISQLAFYNSIIYAGGWHGLNVSNDDGNTWTREEFQSEFGPSSVYIHSIAICGSTIFIYGENNNTQAWEVWKRAL